MLSHGRLAGVAMCCLVLGYSLARIASTEKGPVVLPRLPAKRLLVVIAKDALLMKGAIASQGYLAVQRRGGGSCRITRRLMRVKEYGDQVLLQVSQVDAVAVVRQFRKRKHANNYRIAPKQERGKLRPCGQPGRVQYGAF